MVGLTMALATARPLRRALTSPVLPLVLLAVTAFALLARGSELAALCAAAAVAGVALSGST